MSKITDTIKAQVAEAKLAILKDAVTEIGNNLQAMVADVGAFMGGEGVALTEERIEDTKTASLDRGAGLLEDLAFVLDEAKGCTSARKA